MLLRTITAAIFLLSFTNCLASHSLLSPKISNAHLKLSELDQNLLLLPFKSEIDSFFDDPISAKDSNNLKIVQSSIFIAGSSSLSVTLIVTNKETIHADGDDFIKFHAYLDLDDLSIYDFSSTSADFGKYFPRKIEISENYHQLMAAKNIEQDFKNYLKNFGLSEAAKAFGGQAGQPGENDYLYRYLIFAKNTIKSAWMTIVDRGTATYGTTIFSDLETHEFAKFYKLPGNLVADHLENKNWNIKQPIYFYGDNAPEDYDWRQHQAVTDVKNQGMCGSCWSFSTTGNIEGVHAVATGELISLSEQELVDCDKTDQGCNGGLMDNAFEQIEELGGLEKEEDYKYTAHAGACKLDKSLIAVNISGYHDVPIGDEEAMKQQLLETGPLAVALNAMWMQFYRGGVSHPWKRLCSPKMLDHGVLIVGYGLEPANPDHVPFPKKEQPFWTIKNSWGASWGENGYYRLFRGDGTCGIDQYVTTAEA